MSRLTIDLDALGDNVRAVDRLMTRHGASWTVVTKVLCGNIGALRALATIAPRSVGDSRLSHLRTLSRIFGDAERWHLRLPRLSSCEAVVTLADVSLNSEIETIERLSEAAGRAGRIHRVVIMIELGDLREGILPGSLVDFYEAVFRLPRVEVIGIGTNLGCLAGVPPTVDQLMQLVLYRELLELKFGKELQIISAGSSVILPLLLEGQVPAEVNHFRIGESLFLGTDLVHGGVLAGLRDDVMLLETEIVELKEKGMAATGEVGVTSPFQAISNGDPAPGQRGFRAIVGLGQLDTEIGGLSPTDPQHQIVGASSDVAVVNLGDNPEGLRVGDAVTFRPNYAALLRLMSSRYVDKRIVGGDAGRASTTGDQFP